MHRFGSTGLAIAAVLVVLIASIASWNVGIGYQDMPPEDFPDPTSELLPPVVSDEEWYEYDKAWTEKLLPEIEYGEPVEFYGPESEPGGIITVVGENHKLPDDVYVGWFEMFTYCSEDPHGICGLTPFYALHRVGVETTPADEGEVVIAAGGKRAWFWPALHPDMRPEVHDAYIDFVQSIGIEEIEDHGYVEPYVPVEGKE